MNAGGVDKACKSNACSALHCIADSRRRDADSRRRNSACVCVGSASVSVVAQSAARVANELVTP